MSNSSSSSLSVAVAAPLALGLATGSFLLGAYLTKRQLEHSGAHASTKQENSSQHQPSASSSSCCSSKEAKDHQHQHQCCGGSGGKSGCCKSSRTTADNAFPAAEQAGEGRSPPPKLNDASLDEMLAFFRQLPPKPIGVVAAGEEAHSTAKAIILCASGKGGVGKSTIATNLAFSLKSWGLEVGLLDLDVYGPSLPELIRLPQVQVMQNAAGRIIPLDYGGVAIMSWGYVQPGEAATIRAPILAQIVNQLLNGVGWGALDILVIDSPPGTGDILLTISQTLNVDGAVLVTTSNKMSLSDVEKGIQLFRKVAIPTIGLVANMATLCCEKCGHSQDLFIDDAAKKLPELLRRGGGLELTKIPLDPVLSQTPMAPIPPVALEYPFIRNPDNQDRPAFAALESLALSVLGRLVSPLSGAATEAGPNDKTSLRLRPGGSLELRLRGGDLKPLSAAELRATCRCAECVDEMTGEVRIDTEKISKDTGLKATVLEPRGNYAVHVEFSDGHSSLVSLKALEQKLVGNSTAQKATSKTSDW
mmetsp:Transcript_2689/g.6480  ORF Transcript_2689/g.6480 Transcript_2689/m.6480 type:complete len:532 (-) Transcript_2689:34-1629(-)